MKGESQENLWELEARFAGFVSPVVVDGIVYAGTENRMNALDAQSGEALWSFETAETFWGTPLVADGAVCFGLHNAKVYALDAQTGAFLWAYATDHDVAHMTIADGVIYVVTEQSRLLALEGSTGESIWSYLLEGETSWPVAGDGVVYLMVGTRLVKLDAPTGRELGHIETGRFFQSLTLAGGVLYGLPPFPNRPEPGTAVHALDPATGDVLWASESDAGVAASVSVAGGVAYIPYLSGHLSAFDALTGELLWQHRVEVENEDFVPPRVPTIIDGVVYYRSALCCLYALDAGAGRVLWQHETEAVVSAPAVSDQGIVYVGSTTYPRSVRGAVYALMGPNAGPPPTLTPPAAGVAWMRQVAGAKIVLCEVKDGVVYAWSHDRHIYTFRAETGAELSRFPTTGDQGRSGVDLITDGVAYLTLPNESARALDTTDGTTLWTYVNKEGRRSYTVGISATEGTTYIGLEEELLALRSDTGEKLWRFHTPGTNGPTVLVQDGVAYPHGSFEYRYVYAVDADTGELLWEHQPGPRLLSSPVVVDNSLYVNLSDGTIIALDAATGALLWTYNPALVWERAEDEFSWNFAPSREPPVVADGMVYLGFVRGDFGEPTDERYSEIHTLDAATGNLIWHLPVDGAYRHLTQQDGVVFVTAEDSLKSVRGAEPRYGVDVRRLSGYLHALDGATGNVLWASRTRGNPVSPFNDSPVSVFSQSTMSPLVVRDVVLYVHSFDQFDYEHSGNYGEYGQITAFDGATGEPLWFYRERDLSSMLPWPEAGIIFATLPDGWVYALAEP